MSVRHTDWWLAAALTLLLAALYALSLGPRPADLDLTVTAQAQPPIGQQQRVDLHVRWHWRLHTPLGLRAPEDAIGFVFDQARWGLYNGPGSFQSGVQNIILDRYGEPLPPWRVLVPADRDGEITLSLFANAPYDRYQATVLPVRVQYIRAGGVLPLGDAGWVKATGGELRMEGLQASPAVAISGTSGDQPHAEQ